ncbi:MAG: ADOP family duplicated permease [Terriglobales bacterium]
MRRDFQYAWRQIRRRPGFAVVVLLTLALGIGANTAVFSVINAAYLMPLPVSKPGQIYALQNDFARGTFRVNRPALHRYPLFSYLNFAALRHAAARSADIFAATSVNEMALGAGARQARVHTQLVSGNYFSALRVRPFLGRLIAPNDDAAPDGRRVAVLRYAYWRSRFHGARDVMGTTAVVNHVPLQIIGVAPRGFYGADKYDIPDLWLPLRLEPAVNFDGDVGTHGRFGPADMDKPWSGQPGILWLNLYARVPRGAAGQLTSSGSTIAGRSYLRYASANARVRAALANYRLRVLPASRGYVETSPNQRRAVELLSAMVGLVLLIAACSAALLFLARGLRQQHELAIRLSIGAGRTVLLRQLLAEALLLALAGAALSLAFAAVAHRWLERAVSLPLPAGIGSLGWRVWAFAGIAAVAASALASLIPAWRFRHLQPWQALQSGDTTRATADKLTLGRGLTVAQIALSLLLLLAVGLLGRSVQRLWGFNPGFRTRTVLSTFIAPDMAGYRANQFPELDRRILAEIGGLPGVSAAGLAANGVMNHSLWMSGFVVAPRGGQSAQRADIEEDAVSRNYLQALGVPLLRGRWFAPSDGPKAPQAVLVNRAFVRRFLPGQNPIGATLGYGAAHDGEFHIVGVIGNMRANSIRQSAPPMVFNNLRQDPMEALNLVVSCRIAPGAVAREVRRALAQVAPGMPVFGLMTLQEHIRGSVRGTQYFAELCGDFALLSLGLACLGLGGILAYGVARRRHEIGVRMALGARPGHICGLILRQVAALLGLGLAIGGTLAFWLAPLLRGFLFGVSVWDPAAWLGAVGALVLTAVAAAAWPTLRALRVDPIESLRYE